MKRRQAVNRPVIQRRKGLLLALLSVAWTGSAASADPLHVFVSIPPQKFFVERIGGDHVRVSVLLPPGQSHHTYEPTPKLIAKLGEAEVYFRIGLSFEDRVLEKVAASFPNLTIVDTRPGVEFIEQVAGCTHEHDESEAADDDHEHAHHDHDHASSGHEHAAGELDQHIWLSPRLAKVQAQNIYNALAERLPEWREELTRNFDAFRHDLDELDTRIAASLAPLKGRDFFVYHPAYGYFARDYGLNQVAIESEGKQPTAKALADLIARARALGVKLIVVQPQFGRKNAESVAEAIGGAVIEVDPLDGDYLRSMERIAEAVKKSLGTNDARGIP